MIAPGDVAVILVNYDGEADTLACLEALSRLPDPPGAVIVVDNASPGGFSGLLEGWRKLASKGPLSSPLLLSNLAAPPDLAESPDPSGAPGTGAFLLALDENGGWASGCNAGMRLALSRTSCSAFWLLNNDTLPDPQALHHLCLRASETSGRCLVGSTVLSLHDSSVQCCAGSSFRPSLGFTAFLGRDLRPEAALALDRAALEARLGDIYGASLFLTRQVVGELGFLREDFFMYLEETEYAVRARAAGIALCWARESLVFHQEGGSSGAGSNASRLLQRPVWVDFLMLRNRARLVRDHYPLLLPIFCLSYLLVAARRVARRQFSRVPLVFVALRDGLAGRMGKVFRESL